MLSSSGAAAAVGPCLALRVGVSGTRVQRRGSEWYTVHSFGRVVDQLAARVREVHYWAAQIPAEQSADVDYPLRAPNVHVHPGPVRASTLAAVRRPWALVSEYWHLVRGCDAVFLRGSAAFNWVAHWLARLQGRGIVHWVVGNPVAILQSAPRGYGGVLQLAGLAFALSERWLLRLAMRVSGAYVLANGRELAQLFRSRRTIEVVSTSITADDLRPRVDTCTGPRIRIVFVGYVRPEKGLEYLVRALPQLRAAAPVELAIVGSAQQFPHEQARLAQLATELGVSDQLRWVGPVAPGAELMEQLDRADILALPSLSEGTPRVLIEARARGLPVVSTRTGGIPSSVTDGTDGLLVPVRDADALAAALARLISDGPLRRRLIAAGLERVRLLTLEHFVDTVTRCLAAARAERGRPPAGD